MAWSGARTVPADGLPLERLPLVPVRSTTVRVHCPQPALATLGRRGGQRAAERWKDPESEYAQQQRANLSSANALRSYSTDEHKGQLLALISNYRRQGLEVPTTRELARELGLSLRRTQELRKALGLPGRRGRPPLSTKSAKP
ncbi:hypothetical protein BI335_19780 [Enemella evansiae]|nr:hypothetical protein BI335_19780 [Enemella evansiae]